MIEVGNHNRIFLDDAANVLIIVTPKDGTRTFVASDIEVSTGYGVFRKKVEDMEPVRSALRELTEDIVKELTG